ncbi:MAG TPA: hypothetical protein VGX68_03965 [Thermoanaerobaculia bacterium]|nr:hypothetical protein [Thermoanaerobaculia bacterium]
MRSKAWLSLAALALLTAVPLLGEPRPVGTEFRVNGNVESKQRNPAAAYNAAGTALVVWENDKNGLRGRFYGRDGAPVTGELALVANQKLPGVPAQGTEILRKDAAAAFLASGEFLLAWTEERSNVRVDIFIEQREIVDRDVYLQKFTAAGSPIGSAIRLNATTGGLQSLPKILIRNGADAIVVWQSEKTGAAAGNGIFGRLVRTNGTLNGGEFKVSVGSGAATNPAIAGRPTGEFLVAWEAADGSSLGVFARSFDRSASPLSGISFRVNTEVTGLQRRAAVTADRGTGGYLVIWQGQSDSNFRHAQIYGQFLGAAGSLIGPQFRVSEGVTPTLIAPSVAGSIAGNFLVTWVAYDDVFPVGLYGVEIDGLGHAIGDEVKINSSQINAVTRTSLATSPFGGVLAPWEGFTGSQTKPVISARRVEF